MKISIQRVLQLALVAACFLAPGLARAQAPASDDTYATINGNNSGAGGSPQGASTNLLVNSTTNAYLKFNMGGFSSVGSGSQVQQATLKLFLDTVTNPPTGGTLSVCPLEDSIPWNDSQLDGTAGTLAPAAWKSPQPPAPWNRPMPAAAALLAPT